MAEVTRTILLIVAIACIIQANPSPFQDETESISLSGSISETQSFSLTESQSDTMSISPSMTQSASVSISPSMTQSASVSISPSESQSASVSISPSESQSASVFISPSMSQSASVSISPSMSQSASVSISPSESQSASVSISPSVTYPFGEQQGDQDLTEDDSFFNNRCLQIKTNLDGFLFHQIRYFKLFICPNGLIQFLSSTSLASPTKFGLRYSTYRYIPIIAPFWAPIDSEDSRTKVFYHVYDSDSASSSEAEVLKLASEHVREYENNRRFSNFNASWVLVVTWENLFPLQRAVDFEKSNTFQAVIITDGLNTFLIYNYPQGGIQWVVPGREIFVSFWYLYYYLPAAGWNSGNGNQNVYFNIDGSRTLEMVNIDENIGNTGIQGRYFWRIEANEDGRDSRLKCLQWALEQNAGAYIPPRFLPPCPCSFIQAFRDRRFRFARIQWPNLYFFSNLVLFILPVYGQYEFVWLQQQCVYSFVNGAFGVLSVGPPRGTHVYVQYQSRVRNRVFYDDSEAFDVCCVQSSELCGLFFDKRPTDDCSFYFPPFIRWNLGDPHFNTLDGKRYTFNGIGEYIMIDAKGGEFELQARTTQPQGNSTTGTIFHAAAARENTTSIIEVSVKDTGGLNVLINGSRYMGYDTLTNVSRDVGGNLFVSKTEENCLACNFPSSTAVVFCESNGLLSIVVTLSDSFKNYTRGLMGTWNDDTDDDFTLPNGTILSPSLTSREIHFDFGLKWQINQNQSLFTYGSEQSVLTFADPTFEPMFVDNIRWDNASLEAEARERCGNNTECFFDAAATGDLSIGLDTKAIDTQLVNDSKQLENFPPEIVYAPSVITATIGEEVQFNISAKDNDTITFQVINAPAGALVNTSEDVLYFSWNVNSTEKFALLFLVTDDKGASTQVSLDIKMCACRHGGQCVAPEPDDPLNTDIKFEYLGCACVGGYTGRFCDSNIDACELNAQPCFERSECIDLPPPANETGFKCGPCPSGYTGDGSLCADVDECQENSNTCEQVCINFPGSFSCDCNEGYELDNNRRSCTDIDECAVSNDCMQQCSNTLGSFNCSCNQFFQQDPSDQNNCIPENPCNNNIGCAHICFLGESDAPQCACRAQFKLNADGKTCDDIDECDPQGPIRHLCNQICINEEGGYNCSCFKGFQLSDDGLHCEDVNECLDETQYDCPDELQRCVNVRGAFVCECEPGFTWNGTDCVDPEEGNITGVPTVPPRTPFANETAEAVLINFTFVNWDFQRDNDFKTATALACTDFCHSNRTKCRLQVRLRRDPTPDLYSAGNVHLIPDYPIEERSHLLVAFYVQQPLGVNTDFAAIPANTLIEIVNAFKEDLESAVGANISSIRYLLEPSTTSPTSPITAERSSNDERWIIIGVLAGVILFLLVFLLFLYWYRKHHVGNANKNSSKESFKLPRAQLPLTDFKQARQFSSDDAIENFGADFEWFAI